MDKYLFQEERIMLEQLGLDRKRTWMAVPFIKLWDRRLRGYSLRKADALLDAESKTDFSKCRIHYGLEVKLKIHNH